MKKKCISFKTRSYKLNDIKLALFIGSMLVLLSFSFALTSTVTLRDGVTDYDYVNAFHSEPMHNVSRSKMDNHTSFKVAEITQKLTPHAAIYIDGNEEFAAIAQSEGWRGNGSAENPYVISNISITAEVMFYGLITVLNTDVYFIINNTRLYGNPAAGGAGIHLENVSNAFITNSIIYRNSGNGIFLKNSANIVINNCQIYSHPYNVNLYWTNYTTISYSNISKALTGIYMINANNNNITNNAIVF